MKKICLFVSLLLMSVLHAIGQSAPENIFYIVDSIPVMEDPEEGNDLVPADLADVTIIKNKDSLRLLGYDKYAGAIFIFTKEYRKRTDEVKRIPSSKQMQRKNGLWHFQGIPYSGNFIDYYYSGRKQREGTLKDGREEGRQVLYYQNGHIESERYYVNGIVNGTEKEYYEDGALRQKGEFIDGKESGFWEIYFPNGQVKQRGFLKDGELDGEVTIYYSTGRVLAVEMARKGKVTRDKRLEKIDQAMDKGHASNKDGDMKAAIKNYSKAIDLDSANAKAYFARGTVKLNNFQFDEAILDFNKALEFEPYLAPALSNRAFARIRKYQFQNGRKLSDHDGVTVMASKDRPDIPSSEQAIICADLKQAIFMGDNGKTIMDALHTFCGENSNP